MKIATKHVVRRSPRARVLSSALAGAMLLLGATIGFAASDSTPEPEIVRQQIEQLCTDSVRSEFNRRGRAARGVLAGPPVIELSLKPNETVRSCYRMINNTNQTLEISFETTDVEASADPDSVIDLVEEAQFGISSWIEIIPKEDLYLEPGETKFIPYRITVPDSPPVGDNYGAVIGTYESNSTGSVIIQGALAQQVTVRTPGDVSTDLSITEMNSPGLIQGGGTGPLTRWLPGARSVGAFSFVLKNDGNITAHADTKLTIKSLFGNTIKTFRSDADSTRVPRGGGREVRYVWTDPPWIGRFTPVVTVEHEGGTVTEEMPAVWVIPPWQYILLVVLAIAASLLWWRKRRRDAAQWSDYSDDELAWTDE